MKLFEGCVDKMNSNLHRRMHFTLKKPFCYDVGFVPLLVSYSNFCDFFQISYSHIIYQRLEETLDTTFPVVNYFVPYLLKDFVKLNVRLLKDS